MTTPHHEDRSNPQSWIGHRIGNYELVRLLGEGGMGLVFEAVHDNTGGHVAIKVLLPEVATKPEAIARFFNELRVSEIIGGELATSSVRE